MRNRTLFLIFILCLFCANTSAFTKYVTNNLNLRYEANTHSYILTIIPKGTAITIDEDCNCKQIPVEYNGHVGYISTKYLSNTPVRKTYKHRIGTSVRKGRYSSYNRSGGLRYYTNSYGNRVQSPTYYNSRPAGATALCRDGTYSFSASRRGTCSHHGGVARWYR